jgi:TIR domain
MLLGDRGPSRGLEVCMTKRAFPAPEAAARRGMLRERQDDFVGAAAAYQIAIDSGDPEWAPRAAIKLGNLRERQDDFVGAAAAYQIAIDSGNPEWAPRAAIELGAQFQHKLSDLARAEGAYQLAIDLGADRETVEIASRRRDEGLALWVPRARSPGKKSLKSLFTAAGLAELAPPRASAGDDVDVSVFAPPRAVRGEAMLVLVALHVPEQADHAAALAAEADPDAGRRGVRSLAVPVQLDMPLTIELSLPGFDMDSELQEFRWRGSARLVQFEVFVPEKLERRTVIGTVTVSTNGIPIGHLKWKLPIDPIEHQEGAAPVAQGEHVARYRQAFISYASVDRKEVLARVQMLRTLGVGYFQDILNLDPGDRWEHELYREIDHCDLFLLFWSSAAKESNWVRRETEAALRLAKQNDPFGPPELRPVLIEGPPVPPPWPELAHLHFNDRLLYLMR